MDTNQFKKCPLCGQWFSLEDLVFAEFIQPLGMCLDEDRPEGNFYYFNHLVAKCCTTFVVPVEDFRSRVTELIPSATFAETDRCQKHCLNLSDHRECTESCHYTPYRRLLRFMIEVRRRANRSTEQPVMP